MKRDGYETYRMLTSFCILFISFAYQISVQVGKPLIPILAQSMGASGSVIGFIVAVQSFFPLVLAIPTGWAVDFIGARRVLVLGSLFTIVAGIIYFLSIDLWILFMAQIFAGVGQLSVWLAAQTIATQVHKSVGARDSFVGYFGSFSATGQFLAPILGGVAADAWGYRVALTSVAISGVLIFISSLMVPVGTGAKPQNGNVVTGSYMEAWHILSQNQGVQLAVICSFVPIFVTLLRSSFLPLYLNRLGFSNTSMGFVVALGPLAAILCRASMRVMIGNFSRRAVLFASIFTAFLAMAAVPFFQGFWPLALLSAISGWGSGINEPMTMTLIAAFTHYYRRGIAMGLRLAGNRIAQVISPIIFAAFMDAHGLARAFLDTGILLTIWSAGTIFFALKQRLGSDLGVKDKTF